VPLPSLSPRAVRGLALIAVSLVVLAAVIVLHVRPAPGPAPVPAAARQPDVTSTMDWISPREGWISAFDRQAGTGTLFHTTDGGRHWTRERVAPGVETPEFFDARNGVLTSGAGAFRTSDGGRHWQAMAVPTGARGQRPVFADARHGWVWDPSARGGLLATADGGATWRRLAAAGLPPAPPVPRLLGFRDPAHGWSAVAGALYGTADGGRTWTSLPLPAPAAGQPGLGPLRVAANGRGQLVAGGQGAGSIVVTADGGATWTAAWPLPSPASNLTISRADGAASWAWSATQLQVTRDAGGHWTAVALPGWNLVRVQALDARTAWAAATVFDALGVPRWTMFSTVDGGLTWVPAITPALG